MADLAESRLTRLAKVFGSKLYVELQRHDLESERFVSRRPDAIRRSTCGRSGRTIAFSSSSMFYAVILTGAETPCA